MKVTSSKFELNDTFELDDDFKYCKKCKNKNTKKAKFCFECGCSEFVVTLDKEKNDFKYCAKCQTKLDKSVKFCYECGCSEFVFSLENMPSKAEKEIDLKYQKELDDVVKKIEKRKIEIQELKKENLEIEKNIAVAEVDWRKKIKKIVDDEQLVINENNKLNAELDALKKQLSGLKNEIAVLDKKIDATNNKNNKLKQEVVSAAKKKMVLLEQNSKLKKEIADKKAQKKAEEERIQKAKEEAIKRAKEEEIRKAKEEAIKKAKEEARLKADLEAIRRQNSPEGRFPKVESDFKNGYYSMAFEPLLKLGNEAYSKSYFLLGLSYEYGYGTNKSFDKAKLWYQKSAQSGDPRGSFKVSNIGKEYYTSIPSNILEELAILGDVAAMMTKGKNFYTSGQITGYSNAQVWFDKASYKGSIEALYLAAECRVKNYRESGEAFRLYKSAAERGYKPAQLKLSEIYKSGSPLFDISKDSEKSKYWMNKYKGKI